MVFFLISFFYFSYRRSLRYLRFLQQENYECTRFLRWFFTSFAFDRRATALLLIGYLLDNIYFAAIALALLAYFEKDPRKKGKVLLKLTKRATRILNLAAILYLGSCTIVLKEFSYFKAIICVQLLPLFLPFANRFLIPFEKYVQWKLKREAKERLSRAAPFLIGITGSYGKTSVKHFLGALLQATKGSTFFPRDGVNTEMGITREIRTHMPSSIDYFVTEMAAHYPGSIARIARFLPPDAGIVTCIGEAHLERFGSREVIYKAKSELAQAVKKGGVLVCNGDDPYCVKIAENNRDKNIVFFGVKREGFTPHFCINAIETTAKGEKLSFTWQEKNYSLQTKLFGKPAIYNLAASMAMALSLRAEPEHVIASAARLKNVKNRMSIETFMGVTTIQNGYSSNPSGFASAIDLLANLPSKRKIVMTPGMIELGHEQVERNREAANLLSNVADIAIFVGDTNREALQSGVKKPCEALFVSDRSAAFDKLQQLQKEGDAILIENDLPDLYEHAERF